MGWGLGGSPFAGLVLRYLPSSVIKLFVSVSIFNEPFPCSLYSEPCSLSQTCREIIPLGKVRFVLNSQFQQNIVYTVSIYYNYLCFTEVQLNPTHIRKLEGSMLRLKKPWNVFDNKIIRTFPSRQANTEVVLHSPV